MAVCKKGFKIPVKAIEYLTTYLKTSLAILIMYVRNGHKISNKAIKLIE